jgi:hypothetical protein
VHRLWLKALVPCTKMHSSLVREVLAFLKAHMPDPLPRAARPLPELVT